MFYLLLFLIVYTNIAQDCFRQLYLKCNNCENQRMWVSSNELQLSMDYDLCDYKTEVGIEWSIDGIELIPNNELFWFNLQGFYLANIRDATNQNNATDQIDLSLLPISVAPETPINPNSVYCSEFYMQDNLIKLQAMNKLVLPEERIITNRTTYDINLQQHLWIQNVMDQNTLFSPSRFNTTSLNITLRQEFSIYTIRCSIYFKGSSRMYLISRNLNIIYAPYPITFNIHNMKDSQLTKLISSNNQFCNEPQSFDLYYNERESSSVEIPSQKSEFMKWNNEISLEYTEFQFDFKYFEQTTTTKLRNQITVLLIDGNTTYFVLLYQKGTQKNHHYRYGN